MNIVSMTQYGHKTLLASLDRHTIESLTQSGACGTWSPKDLLAHLTSCELLLVDVLRELQGETELPVLQAMFKQKRDFNDLQVEQRASMTYDEQLSEYTTAYETALDLLKQVPEDQLRQNGLLAWYGEDFDLEDFVVYTIYAHKREHAGQINIFADGIDN